MGETEEMHVGDPGTGDEHQRCSGEAHGHPEAGPLYNGGTGGHRRPGFQVHGAAPAH